LTRNDFVKIRTRQGKVAEVQPKSECWRCGDPVHLVLTRKEPRRAYFTFDAGEGGKMHECTLFPDITRAR